MATKKYDYPEYKTVRQWALAGFLPKENAVGIRIYPNRNYQKLFIYYGPNDVRRATQEELRGFFKPERDRINARRRRLRQEKKTREEN